METYNISPVYGVGSYVSESKEIPSYKDMETNLSLGIHFYDMWTKEKENILVKGTFNFISTLQQKGAKKLMFTCI